MTQEISIKTASDFVTFEIGDQLFGVPIDDVQDVFKPQRLTPVPLSHPDVAGVLNLRGRIVTMIDCRQHLGLGRSSYEGMMAVGVERAGESYGLLIDKIGDVLSPDASSFEANPVNLDPRWRAVSKGVFRLEKRLLIVLNIATILDFGKREAA
ncbi:MAG: chemotaxis protein CheW [Alphaproteobacteria bacterium]|nr:chemotaxis protein CheW [Alphaproteobacteria bacterium]